MESTVGSTFVKFEFIDVEIKEESVITTETDWSNADIKPKKEDIPFKLELKYDSKITNENSEWDCIVEEASIPEKSTLGHGIESLGSNSNGSGKTIITSEADANPKERKVCEEWDKSFRDNYHLNKHLLSHTDERPFSCNLCNKSFKSEESLKLHFRIHTNYYETHKKEKKISCDKCPKLFRDNYNLRLHQRIHSDDSPNTVNKQKEEDIPSKLKMMYADAIISENSAGNRTPNVTLISEHVTLGHGIPDLDGSGKNTTTNKSAVKPKGKKVCEKCNKTFQGNYHLKRHLLSHTDERPFSCEVCSKCFKSEESLKLHFRVHINYCQIHKKEKTFLCDQRENSCEESSHSEPDDFNNTDFKLKQQDITSNLELISDSKSTGEYIMDASVSENSTFGQGIAGLHPISNISDKTISQSDPKPKGDKVCAKCKSSFVDGKLFYKHLLGHINEKPFPCDDCSKSFMSEKTLKRHSRIHQQQKIYSCDDCSKSFMREKCLKLHSRIHQQQKIYSCDKCDKSEDHLKLPKLIHQQQKIYSCDKCEKSFKNNYLLTMHLRSHSTFSCNQCDKSFKTNFNLRMHLHSHSDEKPYVCDVCCIAYKCKKSLKHHALSHTGNVQKKTKEKNWLCEICSKTFDRFQALKRHLRTHAEERGFSCQICNKKFVTNQNLKQHLYTHTRLRKFSCEFCGKAFITKCSLEFHIRTHTGERQFVCNFCKKAFIFRHSLILHQRIHTGEKPHTCNICMKSYRGIALLHRHSLVHSQEKPYSCDQCDKSFKTKAILRSHVFLHTGEKFSCLVCGKEYSTLRRLTQHVHIHHREKHCS